MSRNEARRTMGLPGRPDADELLQPVNVETTDQAQQRQDRADAEAAASTAAATAANTNSATAGLVDELKRLRPHAIDVAGGELESASVIARLEDGTEVTVDVADLRRALAARAQHVDEQVSEAAE